MRLNKLAVGQIDLALRALEDARRGWLGGDGAGPLFWPFRASDEARAIQAVLSRRVAPGTYDGSSVKLWPKSRAKACSRCGGSGFIEAYAHNGGDCYGCRSHIRPTP